MAMSWIFVDSLSLFLVYLAGHIVLTRALKGQRFVFISLISFIVLEIVALYLFWDQGFSGVLFSWSLEASFWIVLMVVLISAQNSVSLRIMDEIEYAPEHAMALKDLEKVVSGSSNVESRLTTMEKNGWLKRSGSELELLPRAQKIAALTLFFRKIFSVEKAG